MVAHSLVQVLQFCRNSMESVFPRQSASRPRLAVPSRPTPPPCRNEPVQPHGSSQCPDVAGTDGRSSCVAHESPAANEPELRPSGEE